MVLLEASPAFTADTYPILVSICGAMMALVCWLIIREINRKDKRDEKIDTILEKYDQRLDKHENDINDLKFHLAHLRSNSNLPPKT